MLSLQNTNGNTCTFKDREYQYQRYCERLTLAKSECNQKPPEEFIFLKNRLKKKQMEQGNLLCLII